MTSKFDSKYYGEADVADEPIEDTLDLFATVMEEHGDKVQVIVHKSMLRDAAEEIRRLRRVCEERKAEIQTLQSVIITLQ